MAQRLVLATRNQGKIVELRRILDAISNGTIELVSVDQYPDIADVEETGSTFEENALLKAVAICKATGLPALADDSGLCVDALGGAPGIFSARYAGKHGDDIANLNKVLVELKSVEDSKRSAHFTCVTALVMPDGRKVTKAGEFHGFIAHAPVGEHGFGYDPIFIPRGSSITSAQMSPHEKDLLSHRGISLRAIAPHVIELLGTLG
jgi:XTP/dITP diphosphohydrolase